MSTLYIRLPSKIAADSLQPGTSLYCEFAQVSNGGAIEREGVAALADLAEAVRRAQRIVLLLAASDVTLLRVKLPPLSAARLKAALPNVVEDQLMSDPADSVIVAGDSVDGLRTIAVAHRGWLELLSRTLLALGARNLAALPSQLCLPLQEDGIAAAIVEHGPDVEVAVRLADQEGLGLPVFAELAEAAPVEALQALHAVVSQASVTLYVPRARVRNYQDALNELPGADQRIKLFADNWSRWIGGAGKTSIDLMTALGMAAGPALNWRPWRWPLALVAAVLLVHATGLNIDWLRMKREAGGLRNTMFRTYKSAYPNETVIVDPLLQMRQKVAIARRESGQLAADDFIALAAAFGDAWVGAGQSSQAIAGLEYRDRSLAVKLKPGADVPMEQIRIALAARNLSLSRADNGIWQIRSAK